MPEDLGRDGLLLLQHKDCYKLDTASVLLAWFASCFVRRGKPCEMLELGSGTGGVSLLASARCKNAHIDGVEINELAYEVFCENIKLNNLSDRITAYNCDLRDLPSSVKDKAYDVVFMNPPFYDGTKGSVTDASAKSESPVFEDAHERWLRSHVHKPGQGARGLFAVFEIQDHAGKTAYSPRKCFQGCVSGPDRRKEGRAECRIQGAGPFVH